MKERKQKKRIAVVFLLTILVVSFVMLPRPAQAFLGLGDLSITIGDIPRQIQRIIDKALTTAYNVFFRNQLRRFAQNLAFNAAVKLAAGGKGQKPLFIDDFKNVLTEAGDAAAGQLAEEIFNATADQRCEVSKIACDKSRQCGLVAEFAPVAGKMELVESREEYNRLVAAGVLRENTLRRERCINNPEGGFLNLGGIDFCNFSLDPLATVRVQTAGVNVFNRFRPASGRCSFAKLKSQFNNIRNISFEDLVDVATVFDSDQNEISAVININQEARARRRLALDNRFFEGLVNKGIECPKDTAGRCITPAPLVETFIKEGTIKFPLDNLKKQTGSLAADFLGTFVNTLAGKMLEKIFNTGFNPKSDSIDIRLSLFGGLSGIQAARQKYADLLEPLSIRQGGEVDLLQQLVTGCETVSQSIGLDVGFQRGEVRQVNNCIIDFDFRDAIDQGLTIRQAIANRRLKGDWAFGFNNEPGPLALADKPGIYSLRSMMVLAHYRVIPQSWVIAAQYIRDILAQSTDPSVKKTYTLNELAFEQYDNPNSPFYHLVDPDWQLKAPATIAWRQGPGENKPVDIDQSLDADGDDVISDDEKIRIISRTTYAADERSCIFEDDKGNCRYFGYCTQEKPIWRFSGETCEARFNTCQTYESSTNGSRLSVLQATVDQDSCSAANAGCRRYSRVRSLETDEWLDSANPDAIPGDLAAQDIYLDRDAPSCDARAAGCSEFLRLSRFSGDAVTAAEVDTALSAVSNIPEAISADYQNFALVSRFYLNGERVACIGEDTDGDGTLALAEASVNVACRLYRPRSFRGGPSQIPAVVDFADVELDEDDEVVVTSWNNECPAECVGYQVFEAAAFTPLYPISRSVKFIPETANSCSAAAEGCTEFTNLNEVARGGEGLEYYTRIRQCAPENDPRAATFFTWEGSEDTGFQLRSWQLVALPDGSPKHSGDSDYDRCNQTIFNLPPDDPLAKPDCREYLSGNVNQPDTINRYYRLHSRVIFASSQCNALRRSGVDEAACAPPGVWDAQANGCIYLTMPAQSQSCSARDTGCRRYQPNGTGAAQVLFNDSFESRTTEGWTDAGEGLENSEESIFLRGRSLRVSAGAAPEKSVRVKQSQAYTLTFWAKTESGSTGPLTALLEGTAGSASFDSGSDTQPVTVEWQQFTLGPARVEFEVIGQEVLRLAGFGGADVFLDNITLRESKDFFLIDKSWATPLACDVMIDGDRVNPEPHPGDPGIESQLGCELYEDDLRNERTLKGFARLCQEEFVGCEALIDTHNSDLVAEQTFVLSDDGGVTVTVPADELAFVVNDRRVYCDRADAGCTELGLVFVDRDQDVDESGEPYYGATFSDAYRILEPEDFTSLSGELHALCRLEENLCDEYTGSGQAGFALNYFKDPQDRVCEFKRNIRVAGQSQVLSAGWVKVGAQPVTASDICQVGDDLPNQPDNAPVCNFDYEAGDFELTALEEQTNFNDAQYPPHVGLDPIRTRHAGCYVYTCQVQDSGCAEFQDPLNPDGCDITLKAGEGRCGGPGGIECRSNDDCLGNPDDPTDDQQCGLELACDYYYFIQSSLTSGISECSGAINPENGCVPFWQTDNEDKFLVGDCQPGCNFELDEQDLDGDGITDEPVIVSADCTADPFGLDPNARPGCLNQ